MLILKAARSAASARSVPKIPGRNSHLARLVGEMVLNAGAGKDDDPHRQCVEYPVVPLERRRLSVAVPVGPKGDLNHAPAFGPACRCTLGARRRRAMQQDHVGRSEERRVGKESDSTCRTRWSPDHLKKNIVVKANDNTKATI